MIQRDEQRHLVYVRRQDMTLFAQVRRTADDIVLPVLHICYPIGLVGAFSFHLQSFDLHVVAYRHGVGTTDTTNAEVAFYMALHIRTIVQADDVTATRRFDD